MRIEGKVWLVTGASSGIGREIALELGRRGAKVAVAARGEQALNAVAAQLRNAGGGALAVPLDVRDDASVAQGVDRVLAAWGRIDGVASVAGNGGSLSPWAETTGATSEDMFAVHVLGAERVLRAVVPAMQRQGSGMFASFASTVAWVPMPGAAAYSAAKAAVVAFSQTWRAELAPHGIDVRVFAPPHTRTAAGLAWPLPLPKVFEPEWVAREFARFIERKAARAIPGGNGSLLMLQRLAPASAQGIMDRIGFEALRRVAARQC